MSAKKYAELSRKAQRERRLRRSCRDKRPYNTVEEARATGNDAYLCKHCRKFHTTGALARTIALARRHKRRLP